jgi:hypothetical protein
MEYKAFIVYESFNKISFAPLRSDRSATSLAAYEDSEYIKLDDKDVKAGTLTLRRLRPSITESKLGSFWIEADIEDKGTELLPVARKGALGGYELSGLARWYMQKDVKAGDRILVEMNRYGLAIKYNSTQAPDVSA